MYFLKSLVYQWHLGTAALQMGQMLQEGEKVLEGWGNDSVGKVFAVQSWGPSSILQNPCEHGGVSLLHQT